MSATLVLGPEGYPLGDCTYKILGKLSDGRFVLHVAVNTGGSGWFTDLMIFRLHQGLPLELEIEQDPPWLLTLDHRIDLGDRNDSVITIQDQTINVQPGRNFPEAKTFIIE